MTGQAKADVRRELDGNALRSGLDTSVMAVEVGNLVIGLSTLTVVVELAFGGLGLVLRNLLRSQALDADVIDLTTTEPALASEPAAV